MSKVHDGPPSLADLNNQLNEARVAAAQRSARQEFAVHQGLRVRVYPSGQASFACRYKAPGSNLLRTLTLAPIGKRISAADLESAQELHRAKKRERDSAVDPLESRDRQRRQAAEEAARIKAEKSLKEFTVKRLVQDYLDKISNRKRSWKEDERIFGKYLLPVLGDFPVVDVDPKAVRKVLRALDGKTAMKRNVAAACRACWNWHGGSNPGERTQPPTPRERILSQSELRRLLVSLSSEAGMARDIVELILLTGVRRAEASGARRDEIEGGEWTIPAERMKGGRPHTVIFSDQANALVARAWQATVANGCSRPLDFRRP